MADQAESGAKGSFHKKRRLALYAAAVLALSVFWTLMEATGALHKLDLRMFDALLSFRKIKSQAQDVALIEIDDPSVDKLGPWPWTRDIIADTLLRLKEVGATTAVFDIEYLSPTKLAVNPEEKAQIEEDFSRQKESIRTLIGEFSNAVTSGMYSADEIPSLSAQISNEYIAPELDSLYQKISTSVFNDNDDFFSKAIQFFGNAWLTINSEKIISVSPEDDAYSRSRFLLKNVEDSGGWTAKSNSINRRKSHSGIQHGFSPAIRKFISMANGAGYTNIIVDRDGTRRRIELLNAQEGGYLGQLVFAPLMRQLDVQSITRKRSSLVLHGALRPDGTRHDISIPLDENGCMLIHWTNGDYADSFKHESIMIISQLNDSEKALFNNLAEFKKIALTNAAGAELSYNAEIRGIFEDIDYVKNFRTYLFDQCEGYDKDGKKIPSAMGQGEDFSELQAAYFAARKDLFLRIRAFWQGGYKDEIDSAVKGLLQEGLLQAEDADRLNEFFGAAFEGVKSQESLYQSTFDSLQKKLSGAFCIIGVTSSGSTDLGSTPFRNFYPNVGTHANVYNTIVSGDFIKPLPAIWGILFASALFLLYALLMMNAKPAWQNGVGAALIVAGILSFIILMAGAGIYVPLVAPVLIMVSSYFAVVLLQFASNEKEKQMIKTTFGAYVAPEVVEQIIKNPKYAAVGGDNKELTALFSDVQKFSKFTEIVNNINGEERGAEKLVDALNKYLGALSDAIQGEKGTIDKYVGDEIVSFFGAPIEDSEHAFHSCAAGIRMLQAEAKINSEFFHEFKYTECMEKPWREVAQEKGWSQEQTDEYLSYVDEYNSHGWIPMLLKSRVGLNTGRMVVGNMGTEKKLNYTIMGNNVNLASRLEGTNKVYGSWIMCAESTWRALQAGSHKNEILARYFDAVRVINVEKPVRIINILGFRSEQPEERIQAAATFNKGMELYMRGSSTPTAAKDPAELKEALSYFKKAAEIYPEDKSSEEFIRRCTRFLKDGIPARWDGVYTMETK